MSAMEHVIDRYQSVHLTNSEGSQYHLDPSNPELWSSSQAIVIALLGGLPFRDRSASCSFSYDSSLLPLRSYSRSRCL
jgi:hypothetical protein